MKSYILIVLITALIACDQNTPPLMISNNSEDQQIRIESLAPAKGFENFGKVVGDQSFHANQLYYEVVLSYGPNKDPRPVFLLANSYIINQQQDIGIEFFERLLVLYESQMTNTQRSTYLSAYALLRATYADNISLVRRISWVYETFDVLERANDRDPNNPLVHWASGIIYSEVPWFFNKKRDAVLELEWLVERPELEPTPGFYREVYHTLSELYKDQGQKNDAHEMLERSGYEDYSSNELFTGWFTSTKSEGLTFSPEPWLEEVIPGKVFSLRGFGFSDMNFVVSKDGKELIAIDAGTQPQSYQEGYEFMKSQIPGLPQLTTLLVTHSHWDHVGGHTFLKKMVPDLKIYGRANFHGTIERNQRNHVYKQFRGVDFDFDWIKDYRPTDPISEVTEIVVGGSSIELIPVTGGETEDAMLYHFPDLALIFMGDALMPFYGEPWTEEGFIDEAILTMEAALKRNPRILLHGHIGINVLYQDPDQLSLYKDYFSWLVEKTRTLVANGYGVKDIIRMNLIPPGIESNPNVLLSYLTPRDHIISRTADRMVGIWAEEKSGQDPEGLDVITSIEYGRLLKVYLGLSHREVEELLKTILSNGDNELALRMAVAAESRYSNNDQVRKYKEIAGDRLRNESQFFDPFKFVTYTELIGKQHPKLGSSQKLTLKGQNKIRGL